MTEENLYNFVRKNFIQKYINYDNSTLYNVIQFNIPFLALIKNKKDKKNN